MIELSHLPIVFLSNREDNTEENLARVHQVLEDRKILHVSGVEGINEAHARACEAALETGARHCIIIEADNWLLHSAREALSLRLPEDGIIVHGHWPMARRIQAYLTYGGVSGWVTSHGGIKVVLNDPEWFRRLQVPDFASLGSVVYSTVPSVLSVERFNLTEWASFRTGFKEATRALRDRHGIQFKDLEQVRNSGVKWRQNLWMWACVGADQPNGHWCQAGVVSALEIWATQPERLAALDWERFASAQWETEVRALCGPILRAQPNREELLYALRPWNVSTGVEFVPMTAPESVSFKANYLGLNDALYR